MRGRSGIEIVMLILTLSVGAMLVLLTTGLVIFKIINPTQSLEFGGSFFDLLKIILSAIVGYVAGKGISTKRGTTDLLPNPDSTKGKRVS